MEKTPQLFLYNAFCVIANEKEAKMGAVGNPFRLFYHWHRIKEEDSGDEKTIEILLKGTCEKNNFLDLLKNFTIFQESFVEGEEETNQNKGRIKKLIKIIARNHQFLGVNLAFESWKRRKEKDGKIGTFWHTQGSGKSFSILFFTEKARKEAIKRGEDIAFVIIVDRQDLERQMFNNFRSCNILGRFPEECLIKNKTELKWKISDKSKSYIFSIINKFDKFEDKIEREVVIVADEAHRTQYGDMAHSMYKSFENSSRIGFTGTPILKDDEITARYFGGYVSKYDFSKAIADKVTVPLVYINKVSRAKRKFLPEKNEKLPIKTGEHREKSADQEIRENEFRMRNNAKDFVSYYSERFFDLEKEKIKRKAMFVCSKRKGCILMWNFAQEYWKEEINRLKDSLQKPNLGEREAHKLRKKMELMEETEMKVVIDKWSDIDLEELKILYGQQIEMPEKESEAEKEDRFKNKSDVFRIVFVNSMWLTGFDVKSLTYLFIDRGLKEHSLMQTIARPNRIDEGKTRGFIIDYFGLATQIDKCLGKWGKSHEHKIFINSQDDVKNTVSSIIFDLESLLKDRGVSLKKIIEQKLNKEKKKKVREEIKKIMNDPKLKTKFNKNCELLFEDTKYLTPEDFSKENYKKFKWIKDFYKKINEKEKPKKIDIETKTKNQDFYNSNIEFLQNKENYSKEINENINKSMNFYFNRKRQNLVEIGDHQMNSEEEDEVKKKNIDISEKEEEKYDKKINQVCEKIIKSSSPEELHDSLGNLSDVKNEYEGKEVNAEDEDYEEVMEEREEVFESSNEEGEGNKTIKEEEIKEETIEKWEEKVKVERLKEEKTTRPTEISELIDDIEFLLSKIGVYLKRTKEKNKFSDIFFSIESKQKIISENMKDTFIEKRDFIAEVIKEKEKSLLEKISDHF
ncbi:HsdR family type I site-specific deoxyribonuclease [Mycoplasma suis]|nr:HsdR family type I site-specific deoxyribonuclease [Mycoplasma suis]